MARGPDGRFKPGTSGNPGGRPPRGWALSDILGKSVGKLALRRLIRGAIERGVLEFPDRSPIELSQSEWLEIAKWVFNRVDGLPAQAIYQDVVTQQVEVTGEDVADAAAEVDEWELNRNGSSVH